MNPSEVAVPLSHGAAHSRRREIGVSVTDLNREDLYYIADRLRDWDRREIFAMRWTGDTVDLVEDTMRCGEFGYIVRAENPIAAIGAAPLWPGVWSVWCYGTDEFTRAGLTLTKLAVRIRDTLRAHENFQRAFAYTMQGHHESQAWLERLGMVREAVLKHWGRNGQTFYLYNLPKLKE